MTRNGLAAISALAAFGLAALLVGAPATPQRARTISSHGKDKPMHITRILRTETATFGGG